MDGETLERLLADALTSADPVERLRGAVADPALGEPERALLRTVDEDGLRIAALLVAKLRFERLLQGSSRAGEAFETDARAFSAAFKRYHLQEPPRSESPSDEARRFEAWLAAQPPA